MRLHAAGLICLTALLAAGCGTVGPVPKNASPTGGKELFIKNCGSCHTLADAGTLGKVGPNLDDAFRVDREEGFSQQTIADVVRDQIAMAIAPMPANLVTGADADTVAAYVASVAGLPPGGVVTTTAPATTQQTTTQATTTQATTTTSTAPPPAAADVAKGKALFTSLGCTGCHSIDGTAGTGPTLKGVAGSTVKLTGGQTVTADDTYLLTSIFDPDKQIVDGFTPGIMSAVIKPGSVSQADARALVAYIDTLK